MAPPSGIEPAPHEHLDDPSVVGGDDEVGREHHRRTAPGGGAVERRRGWASRSRGWPRSGAGCRCGSCAPRRPTTRSGAPSGLGGGAARPVRRSAPVQKCFSPAAVRTIARTSNEPFASARCSIIRLRTAGVIALPASGRLSVSQSTSSLDLREQLLVDVDLVHRLSSSHCCSLLTTRASRATAPRGARQRVDVELGELDLESARDPARAAGRS